MMLLVQRRFVFIFVGMLITGVLVGCCACMGSDTNTYRSENELYVKETDGKSFWVEEDFSFYDSNGKERMFPTTEDYWIHMKDGECLQTHRGVEIGDRGSSVAKLYDLSDFEWSISDFSKLNPSTEESKSYQNELLDQGKNIEDILNMLPEISSKGFDVYIWCDVYEVDGILCTESEIGSITENDVRNYFNIDESIDVPERYYDTYKWNLLKYSISFSIESGKISDVSIESSYHNRLHN